MTLRLTGAALKREIERYVVARFGVGTEVLEIRAASGDQGEKGFGYGEPIRIELREPTGARRGVVLHTSGSIGFGHDTLADRAAMAVEPFETFALLPEHVRALDVGTVDEVGRLASLGTPRDFFFLTEWGEGTPYFHDLDRIAREGSLGPRDHHRVDLLASYLARVHGKKEPGPHREEIWRRRWRMTVGHHEGIAGLVDSYFATPECERAAYASDAHLLAIEQRCVALRHAARARHDRLCQVHGDFHPWNLLFGDDDRLVLLDRSRGDLGEAADDVAALAINHLFYGLRAAEPTRSAFRALFERFFERYLEASHDEELGSFLPVHLAWRGLVVASPVWYPHLTSEVRRALFDFIDETLANERFDWTRVRW